MKWRTSFLVLCLIIGVAIAQSEVEDAFESDLDEGASDQDLAVAESVGTGGGKGGGAAGKAAAAAGAKAAVTKGNINFSNRKIKLIVNSPVHRSKRCSRSGRRYQGRSWCRGSRSCSRCWS